MKPLKTEIAFTTPWLEVVAKTMQAGEEPYYSLRLPEYVAVVALTPDERILLVRQYRPAVEQFTLELPSGLVDPGETPEQTARRELVEETGHTAEVAPLGAMFVDSGRMNNRIWGFVAAGARPVDSYQAEPGIEVVRYSIPELWKLTNRGEFALSHHVGILLQAVLCGALKLG